MGQGAEQLVSTAFHMADEMARDEEMEEMDGIVSLPGVVSRKKQLAPQIMMALQQVSGGSWRILWEKRQFKPGEHAVPRSRGHGLCGR